MVTLEAVRRRRRPTPRPRAGRSRRGSPSAFGFDHATVEICAAARRQPTASCLRPGCAPI